MDTGVCLILTCFSPVWSNASAWIKPLTKIKEDKGPSQTWLLWVGTLPLSSEGEAQNRISHDSRCSIANDATNYHICSLSREDCPIKSVYYVNCLKWIKVERWNYLRKEDWQFLPASNATRPALLSSKTVDVAKSGNLTLLPTTFLYRNIFRQT